MLSPSWMGLITRHGLEKARSCCLDTTSLDHLQKSDGGIGSTGHLLVDDQDTLGRLSTLDRRRCSVASGASRNRFLFMFFAFLALLSAILFSCGHDMPGV